MALKIDVDLGIELEETVTISEGSIDVVVTFGQTITIDDTVTETSPNAVNSSGIWTWVKSLINTNYVPYVGFEDKTDCEISDVTEGDEYFFRIAPTENEYIFYSGINKYTKTEEILINILEDFTLYYIYFDAYGELQASTDEWDLLGNLATIATYYRNDEYAAITDYRKNITSDLSVTETSLNTVISSGIWTWVKSLLTGFLSLDQTIPQTITGGIPLLDEDHLDFTAQHQLVDKEYVDRSVAQIGLAYYLLDAADDLIPAYKTTALTPSILDTTTLNSAAIADSTDTLIGSWVSLDGLPFTELTGGVYNLNIYAERLSGNRTCRLFWKFYERESDGNEILIATSTLSNEITDKARTRTYCAIEDYTPAEGSRLIGKIYVNTVGGGSPTTVQLSYQGNENSHWSTPVSKQYLDDTFAPLSHTTQASDAHIASAITVDTPFTPVNAVIQAGNTGLVAFQRTQGQINALWVIEEITTSKVLGAADSGKYFFSTAAAAINVTVPASTLTKPVVVYQKGNGVVSYVNGAGVTNTGKVKTGGIGFAIFIAPETATHNQITGGVA